MMKTVLVTGGTGFVGGHAILHLLRNGYAVRTTVRDVTRAAVVREMVAAEGVAAGEHLSFVVADLESDDGWQEAVEGCEFVLHVASPFPLAHTGHEDDLIRPARDGTLRVLRAARAAGVKRVVYVSSFGAVGYGHAGNGPFLEDCWTDVDAADVQPYVKSKTLAERAAWDFVEGEGRGLELVSINPAGIFGPALHTGTSSSIGIIKTMLEGYMPVAPPIYFGVVDVRDVADLLLRAATTPQAAGERFVAVSGEPLSLLDVAKALHHGLGERAVKAPHTELTEADARHIATENPQAAGWLPQLGIVRRTNSEKARAVLGWNPRPADDAIVASGESLLR
jgi:dihydroflavonol-4-reductase